MQFQGLKYDVVGDIAGRGREISARPEAPAPVALAQLGELHLDAAGGAGLDALHRGCERKFRRHVDDHVHMIARQDALDDIHAHLGAGLGG